MKRNLFAIITLVLVMGATAWGSLLLEENFDYVSGDYLTDHGWSAHSVATPKITVGTPGLTYTNYLSNIGNCATLSNTGEDVNKTFTQQTSGVVYASFIVNISSITSTTGDYFFHLGPSTIGTTYVGRVYARKDGSNNVSFGIAKYTGGAGTNWTPYNYSLATDYFIVLKYTINSGTANDDAQLFISPEIGAIEPTPTISCIDGATADPANIGSVALRQGSSTSAPVEKVDGIRIGTSWADVALAVEPTIQASGVSFTNVGSNQMDVSWNRGNGSNCIVLCKAGSPVDANPVDITTYTSDAAFGNGSQVGSLNYVVYNGTGTSVTVTNLQPNTTYYFAVYEYSGTTLPNYLITSPATGSQSTSGGATPTISITGTLTNFGNQVVSTSSSSQSYSVSGSNLTDDITITAPTNFEVSTDNSNFYGSRVLTQSGGSVPSTTIYVRFSPGGSAYGAQSGNITHASSGATTVNQPVAGNGLDTEPSTQASGLSFSDVTASSMTVSWTRGNGDSVIVLARASSDLSTDPADGTDYSANAAYGSGAPLGGGYVIYKGEGTSVNLTGLSGGTTYYLRAYEYNSGGVAGSANYNVTSPASGSQGTNVATYIWNHSTSTDWAVADNWTPARTTPGMADIIEFNEGGSITVTNVPTQTIGKLILSNSTAVTLQTGGSNTLTISGGSGVDLDVPSGCELNYGGSNALVISLSAGATGSISGNMTFSSTVLNTQHRLLATDPSSITFNSGSVFTAGTNFGGNAFGTTNLNSVVFASGSIYVAKAGANPFGANQPNSVVIFQTGSLYRHENTGAISVSGRTYADFEMNVSGYNNNATSGSALMVVDNLTLNSCTLLGISIPGGIAIKGNINVNSGTLSFRPGTATTITFNGTGQQTISGSGTIVFGDTANVTLNNSSGLVLQRNLTINGILTLTSGNITTGTNTLTLGPKATLAGEQLGRYAIGNLQTSRAVGTGSSDFGGMGVGLSTGADDLGTVNVTRVSGPDAYVVASHTGTNADTSICRRWIIISDNPPSSGRDLTLSWLPDDDNGRDLTTAHFWRSVNGSEPWVGVGSVHDASATRSITETVTEFSHWTVSDADNPMAVALSSFSALATDGAITLSWRTESENGSYQWIVERSDTERGPYVELGRLAAAGNSASPRDYSWADRTARAGASYWYRIGELSQDGRTTYFGPVSSSLGRGLPQADLALGCAPNPFRSQTEIRYQVAKTSPVSISIYNISGQLVRGYDLGVQPAGYYQTSWDGRDLDGRKLSAGVYLYRITIGGRQFGGKAMMVR